MKIDFYKKKKGFVKRLNTYFKKIVNEIILHLNERNVVTDFKIGKIKCRTSAVS